MLLRIIEKTDETTNTIEEEKTEVNDLKFDVLVEDGKRYLSLHGIDYLKNKNILIDFTDEETESFIKELQK